MNFDFKEIDGGVCAPGGFRAAAAATGIKHNGNADMAAILCDHTCPAAAMFTTNKVTAAPVVLSRSNIADGYARGILANSGNANACNQTAADTAQQSLDIIAGATSASPSEFIIASTGVIGQDLPARHFTDGIPEIIRNLSHDGSGDAARAIMTTDTIVKEFAVEFDLGGVPCRIGAIGKGSGMININLATMLVFITTDVAITPGMLKSALGSSATVTLNQVYIDGDMSTNDTTAILASGNANNKIIESDTEDYNVFCAALTVILTKMSRALARDGEGATKLIECRVTGATSNTVARAIAKTVVGSDLFKAAVFAADANWGRAICAVGYTPGNFPVDDITITLKSRAGEVVVCSHSTQQGYDEQQASTILGEDEITVAIDMGDGNGKGAAWGCDLTYDYIKINAEYRS